VDEQKDFRMFPASNRFQQAPFGEERIREIVEREATGYCIHVE
jgi:hypothetical protein